MYYYNTQNVGVYCISVTKTISFRLQREIITVYCKNHTKQIHTVLVKCRVLSVKIDGKYDYHWGLKV
jgi:hypothetical protein